jgi:hypothetical protein
LVLDFSKEYANKTKDIQYILDEEGDTFVTEVSHTNLKNFSSGIMLKHIPSLTIHATVKSEGFDLFRTKYKSANSFKGSGLWSSKLN